ncbi:hypothetical protein PMAYCL1PPCAC_16317, partial [Pristionchus mayeri]
GSLKAALVLVAVNYRAWMKMKEGACVNRYSVAKSFQIRENIVILKALAKLAVRLIVLNVPIFVLALCHLFLAGLERRMFSRAFFDLIISMYPLLIITYIPLSDVIFERALKRMSGGERLFQMFAALH